MHSHHAHGVFPAVFAVFDAIPERAEPVEKLVHGHRLGIERFRNEAVNAFQAAHPVVAG